MVLDIFFCELFACFFAGGGVGVLMVLGFLFFFLILMHVWSAYISHVICYGPKITGLRQVRLLSLLQISFEMCCSVS